MVSAFEVPGQAVDWTCPLGVPWGALANSPEAHRSISEARQRRPVHTSLPPPLETGLPVKPVYFPHDVAGAPDNLAAVRGLAGPPHTWTLGAMPLTALMSLERRKGAVHPVIGKKLVDLQGRPFLEFAAARAGWAEADSWPTARQVRAEFLPTAPTPPQTVVLETTGAPPIPTSPVGGAAADGAGYPRFEQRS